jgi:hypothetical protein
MPFEKATKALFNRVHAISGGEKITYNYASGGSDTLDAIIGSTDFTQGNQMMGQTFLLTSHDFTVRVSDLSALPERGDSIVFKGKTYTVMIDSGSAMYRFSDYSRQNIRIHTKELT